MASLVGHGYSSGSSGDDLFGGELFGGVEQGSPCDEMAQSQVSTQRARGRAVAQA
jgi:hypothetical protein